VLRMDTASTGCMCYVSTGISNAWLTRSLQKNHGAKAGHMEGSSALGRQQARGWKGPTFGSSPLGLRMVGRLTRVGLVAGSAATLL
jgi:hypothetical protein